MEDFNPLQVMEDACITTYDKFVRLGDNKHDIDYHIEYSIAKQISSPGIPINEFTRENNARFNMASLSSDQMVLALAHCALKVQEMKKDKFSGAKYEDEDALEQARVLQAYVNSENFAGLKAAIVNGAFLISHEMQDSVPDVRLKKDCAFTQGLLTLYRSFVVDKRLISSGNSQNMWTETMITDEYLQDLEAALYKAFDPFSKKRS